MEGKQNRQFATSRPVQHCVGPMPWGTQNVRRTTKERKMNMRGNTNDKTQGQEPRLPPKLFTGKNLKANGSAPASTQKVNVICQGLSIISIYKGDNYRWRNRGHMGPTSYNKLTKYDLFLRQIRVEQWGKWGVGTPRNTPLRILQFAPDGFLSCPEPEYCSETLLRFHSCAVHGIIMERQSQDPKHRMDLSLASNLLLYLLWSFKTWAFCPLNTGKTSGNNSSCPLKHCLSSSDGIGAVDLFYLARWTWWEEFKVQSARKKTETYENYRCTKM